MKAALEIYSNGPDENNVRVRPLGDGKMKDREGDQPTLGKRETCSTFSHHPAMANNFPSPQALPIS